MQTISVIIPTHNRAGMLGEAVESVCNQSLAATEIIIVDDGSDDETEKLVPQLAASGPIVYLRQTNRGPAAARNLGISRATSECIAFLDSDDIWHKKKLEIQSEAMADSPRFLISHTRERWYRNGRYLNQKRIHQPRHGSIFAQSLNLCCVGMSTVMVRKELFDTYGLFDETLRCCEDYDLWLRISAYEEFLLVDRRLTDKRGGRSDQVSSHYQPGMDRYRIQALGKLLRRNVLTKTQRELAGAALRKKCMIYGQGCCKHGKSLEGGYYLEMADNLAIAYGRRGSKL